MKPVEVPTAEPRSGSPVPDLLGYAKGAGDSRPRAATGTETAGQIIAALALTSQKEFEKPRLKSCFRSAVPTFASFDVDWFRTICLAARNLDHVHSILRMFHEGIGANACAFGSVGPTRFAPIFELLVEVPDSLLKAIKSRRVIDDPIAVACEQRILGFAASDLGRVIEMNDARRKTMAIYAAHGLFDGFTVPFCVPGEPRGYCSFGFANPDALTVEVMAIINLAAAMLFETSRRVLGMWIEHRLPSELTPRQIDCVAGVAQGMNDLQIGWDLGISVQTVREHLEAARKRSGARTRTDLAVQAIRSNDLHWNRIVGDPTGSASTRRRSSLR